jgi:hypothetical protein
VEVHVTWRRTDQRTDLTSPLCFAAVFRRRSFLWFAQQPSTSSCPSCLPQGAHQLSSVSLPDLHPSGSPLPSAFCVPKLLVVLVVNLLLFKLCSFRQDVFPLLWLAYLQNPPESFSVMQSVQTTSAANTAFCSGGSAVPSTPHALPSSDEG